MNKMIIAFDGPDNVGKSTQIKLLRKKYDDIPFLIFDVDAPVGTSHEKKLEYGKEHSRRSLEAMRMLPFSQIHDRVHFTEYAYSFFRNGHDLDEFLEMEKKYQDLKESVFIITFIDATSNISDRDDGLSQFKKEAHDDIEKLISRFQEISQRSLFDNSIINIHNKDIETVHNEVISVIENKFKK